ncbi:MAG: D-tyrosyl-tRNA(Tyr) deacylase [Lachnospiraceae bacterium]|nr:D-tyrosyl-tRNA(Tyr) deacylase [Lachnospiraceae bacterium]
MRFLIQRVNEAHVQVEGQVIGKIGKGLLVFVGISRSDFMQENNSAENEDNDFDQKKAYEIADKMIKKLIGLRIFEDENGKTNLDMKAVGGQLLMISQFTLYADCRKGNRPSFVNAGDPQKANDIYRYVIDRCKKEIEVVEEGSFGANMQISLVNDGPFTIILDSAEICK